MNVKNLIELLQKQNPDAPVFISVDEEGNDFKPVNMFVEACDEDEFETSAGDKINGIIIFPIG